MAKTILQALKDEIGFPVKQGFFENRLIARGMNSDDEFSADTAKSDTYWLTYADCLKGLVVGMPNIVTEGDLSLSGADKDNMLKIANGIYTRYGEDDSVIKDTQPTVTYIGEDDD